MGFLTDGMLRFRNWSLRRAIHSYFRPFDDSLPTVNSLYPIISDGAPTPPSPPVVSSISVGSGGHNVFLSGDGVFGE